MNYTDLAAKLFCFLSALALVVLFFKYAFPYVVPFAVAWGVAHLIYPAASALAKRTRMSRRLCSALLVGAVFASISAVLIVGCNVAINEISRCFRYLDENSAEVEGIIKGVADRISSVGEGIPFLEKMQDRELVARIADWLNGALRDVFSSALERVGAAIPAVASNLLAILPDALIVCVVTVVACFYFAADIDVVKERVASLLPPRVLHFIRRIKRKLGGGFKRYIRACGVLFLITFAELFVGFLILGIERPFLLAVIIAFIDLLPLLGTAAVLLPWGAVLLAMGESFLGIGILVLLLVMTLIRQAIEPKIVGDSLGIHPLISLASMYIGYKLVGFFGMVIAPLAALALFSDDDHA